MQLFVLLLSLLAFLAPVLASSDCSFDSNMGATFNLNQLARSGDEPSYIVTDGDIPCTKEVEQNYTYLFNVCRDVSGNIPAACSKRAAALQIDKRLTLDDPNDDWCFVAGYYDPSVSSLALIDSSDPTEGVKLTYSGDNCKHDADGNPNPTPRKFHLEFECANTLNPVPVHAYEYAHCEYTVSIRSIYGCPLECPIANRELCNGHGYCGYDKSLGQARCFCDDGYDGLDCNGGSSTSSSSSLSSSSSTLTGLIVVMFVVSLGLVGAIFYMIQQIRAYKQDSANYMALRGDDSEIGV
jgi:hypothetical protein